MGNKGASVKDGIPLVPTRPAVMWGRGVPLRPLPIPLVLLCLIRELPKLWALPDLHVLLRSVGSLPSAPMAGAKGAGSVPDAESPTPISAPFPRPNVRKPRPNFFFC